MFKYISICATVVALGSAAANAQQQAAILQNVELPGTGLDIILAMPKSPGATINLAMSPDAVVVNLIGGKLAVALSSENEMMKARESLQRPACAFQTQSKKPVAVYVVPSHAARPGIRTASLIAQEPGPIMRKVDVPGSNFDIVFAMTKTPIVVDANERPDSLAVYSAGSELVMATAGDVERMFKDVGLSQLPICAFEVEHKGSELPQAASVYIIPKSETPALAVR